MDSTIEKIKDKLDIVDVIGNYLTLQKAGANYRANCPFHSEKSPSFFVSPGRQIFKCFGCGESGSIFDFVMKMEGVDFKESLKILAGQAGVELPSYNPQIKTEREEMFGICELATRFFQKQLKETKNGKEAESYLKKRGVSEKSLEKWRLGYAPEKWRALSDFLVSKGYDREKIVKVGLAIKSEKGGTPYDRFRKRIIFPVFDIHGRVIGFGGRITDKSEDTAKYMNTPNTPLYDKSKTLYGLNFAKVPVRKEGFAIMAEGYMDVIMSHQAGVETTVSSSGTSLTENQLRILKRYTETLYTAFDMDSAGGMATEKSVDMARNMDFSVKMITMPKDKDPADVACDEPKKLKKMIEEAKDSMEYFFIRAFEDGEPEGPEEKKKAAKKLLSKIAGIPDKIISSHWLQKLSEKLNVPEDDIREELKIIEKELKRGGGLTKEKRGGELVNSPNANFENNKKSRKRLIEEEALSILFLFPHLAECCEKERKYLSAKTKKIVDEILEKKPQDKKAIEKLLNQLSKDKNLEGIINEASIKPSLDEEVGEEDKKQEILACIKELKKIHYKKEIDKIHAKIREAEQQKNGKELTRLLNRFNQKIKNINT